MEKRKLCLPKNLANMIYNNNNNKNHLYIYSYINIKKETQKQNNS